MSSGIRLSADEHDQFIKGLVKTGLGYFIIWKDQRSGSSDIYGQMVDYNGNILITAGDEGGKFYGINTDGSLAFMVLTGNNVKSSAGLIEIDNNIAIFFGSEDGNLYAVDINGNNINGWPQNITDMTNSDSVLKINSTLINLNLSWNHLIGLEGIRSLSECLKINSTITTLHLSSNKMGDQEIDLLCESLILNSTLKELDLSYNNIGDEGMKIISETLKINSSLEDINLFNNKIKDKGAHSLLEALFFNYSLKNLTINGNQNKIGEYLQDEISNMVKENKSKPERAIKRVEKNMKKSSLIKFSLIFLVNLFFLLF